MSEHFAEWSIVQIPRSENTEADSLAKMATSLTVFSDREVIYQVELAPAHQAVPVSPERPGWMTSLVQYIKEGKLPENKIQTLQLKRRALRFVMVEGMLYKRSFSRPLLRCLGKEEAEYVLKEIHEGCCGDHLGAVALARKALMVGYWWPTMYANTLTTVRKCERCQRHDCFINKPASVMKPVLSACPFDQWCIDIVGSFPTAPAQKKFLLVAVDYFSKWVKAEALARITEGDILRFLWRSIVCRYGVPRRLVSDNGRQFQGQKVLAWCKEMKIEQRFTSVAYPQANGQTEVTNRSIVQALKQDFMEKRRTGWKSCPVYYGHIEPLQEHPHERTVQHDIWLRGGITSGDRRGIGTDPCL